MEEIWPNHLVRMDIEDLKMSYAVDSALDNSHTDKPSTTKTFPFLKLPPEIRDKIYKPLIQAGDLSILRVSKIVNMETLPYLFKVGTLRITLGGRKHKRIIIPRVTGIFISGSMTLLAPYFIQNLDIRLDITSREIPNIDTQFIKMFSGKEISRKTCNITVRFGILGPVRHLLNKNEFYAAVSTLTGFETLTLRLEDQYNKGMLKTLIAMTMGPGERPGLLMCATGYERLFHFLSPTLGPAQFPKSFDGTCLIFWPLKYKRREKRERPTPMEAIHNQNV